MSNCGNNSKEDAMDTSDGPIIQVGQRNTLNLSPCSVSEYPSQESETAFMFESPLSYNQRNLKLDGRSGDGGLWLENSNRSIEREEPTDPLVQPTHPIYMIGDNNVLNIINNGKTEKSFNLEKNTEVVIQYSVKVIQANQSDPSQRTIDKQKSNTKPVRIITCIKDNEIAEEAALKAMPRSSVSQTLENLFRAISHTIDLIESGSIVIEIEPTSENSIRALLESIDNGKFDNIVKEILRQESVLKHIKGKKVTVTVQLNIPKELLEKEGIAVIDDHSNDIVSDLAVTVKEEDPEGDTGSQFSVDPEDISADVDLSSSVDPIPQSSTSATVLNPNNPISSEMDRSSALLPVLPTMLSRRATPRFDMDADRRQDIFKRCEEVLDELQGVTESTSAVVEKTRNELGRISSEMENPPKLTVAVYGDTGSGKSSLLNALLDQPSALPTSGMGTVCTSVVIKIEENKHNNDFEADVEFITKEEWEREISVLTKNLKVATDDTDDDVDDVYDSARAMVTAVYGDFEEDDLEKVLKSETNITGKLGTVLQLCDEDAGLLRDKICQYIETADEGFQYWPIVKQVILRIPKSDLCKSGTELIDLPGVGDSNPARDNVARKYFRTCDVLIIVTKIQRAVDSKTVKNVLGETMFRQVQMDHRKTVLACTQTDDVKPSEVIRKLNLPQSRKWTEENRQCTEEERQLKRRLAQPREELQDKADERERRVLNEQETEMQKTMLKLHRVQERLKQNKKEKSSMCAVERNKYVKRIIQKKRTQASTSDDAITDMAVFCVSSADYIKLSIHLTCDEDDDKSPVFISAEQTEIPDLRNFLRNTAKKNQDRNAESLRKVMKGVISGMITYLSNLEQGGKALSEQTLERNLTRMKSELQNVVKELEKFIEELYNKYLDQALEDATVAAEKRARQTSDHWARPVNTRHRERGGLAFSTYKATVQRYGQFTSQKIGFRINLNEDLTDPFVRAISPKWQEMFSEATWDDMINGRIKEPIIKVITNCSNEILQSLPSLGFDVNALNINLKRLITGTTDKLTKLDKVGTIVKLRQRQISAHIPSHVQDKMKKTYELCQAKVGPGSFKDMKETMAEHVDELKVTMFRNIKETVKKSLESLKDDVIFEVNNILDEICDDHRTQIEPLWRAYGGAGFSKNELKCKEKLEQLYAEIEEYERSLPGSAPLSTSRKRQSEGQSPLGVEKSKAPRQM